MSTTQVPTELISGCALTSPASKGSFSAWDLNPVIVIPNCLIEPHRIRPSLTVTRDKDLEVPVAVEVTDADPGLHDITCDVDFTEVARLAREFALDVSCFAHQSAILAGCASLSEAQQLDALGARLSRDVGYAPSVGRLVAPYVMKRFLRSPCYWQMRLSPHHIPALNAKAPAEMQPEGKALWTLAKSVGRGQLVRELKRAGLPEDIAGRLKSCGDIAADLSDAGMFEHYGTVIRLLESNGWLRAPGAVCA